jgi:hypothetical protein
MSDDLLPKQISALRSRLTALHEITVANPDLGADSFQEAEDYKNAALDFSLALLDRLGRSITLHVSAAILFRHLSILEGQFDTLQRQLADIGSLAGQKHQPGFPGMRKAAIEGVQSTAESIQMGLLPLDSYLGILELRAASGELPRLRQEGELAVVELKARARDATLIVANLQGSALRAGVTAASYSFLELENAHIRASLTWFSAFVVLVVFTIGALAYLLQTSIPSGGITVLIAVAIKRLLLIAVLGALAKVALSKFNLERNLRIIYAHRTAVLEQFTKFESAIGNEDREAKNQFRLEIARLVFSDPETGYTGAAASEFNVNPAVSIAERVAKQG